jgi:ornithine cyclodeaminase
MVLPSIDERTLRAAIRPDDAVTAIREAFRADGEGRTLVPAVINLPIPGTRGEFHVKTAWVDGAGMVAVKVASGFYDNPARGLPTGSGLMALFDATTGMPVGILFDNGFLTDIRTGAAGAVAAEFLAPASITTVGIIGSGVQARQQAMCLRGVRSYSRLVAWSPNPSHLASYCDQMHAALGVEVRAASGPEEVCRESDVLVTTTPARQPIVRASWLRPGMHMAGVGAGAVPRGRRRWAAGAVQFHSAGRRAGAAAGFRGRGGARPCPAFRPDLNTVGTDPRGGELHVEPRP